jgi:chemotaxis protein methyltransferase CheR
MQQAMTTQSAILTATATGESDNREYIFTAADFNRLRDRIGSHSGISLSDNKQDLVYGRLSKRLRKRGLSSFSDYCELLESGDREELEHFVNALTTNLTSFFREQHHFDHLRDETTEFLSKRLKSGHPVRIWSAGCSTGEEPYSIAMTLAESIPGINNLDIRILATDLDTNVIAHAANGIYDTSLIEGLPKEKRNRWFQKGSGKYTGLIRASDTLRKLVTFRPLNLMDTWPMTGLFDVVFCRNVVIYFDKPTRTELFNRFADSMQPDSTLFIGHSETLHNVSDRFVPAGKTIYRKAF